jgi:hypothetical protein
LRNEDPQDDYNSGRDDHRRRSQTGQQYPTFPRKTPRFVQSVFFHIFKNTTQMYIFHGETIDYSKIIRQFFRLLSRIVCSAQPIKYLMAAGKGKLLSSPGLTQRSLRRAGARLHLSVPPPHPPDPVVEHMPVSPIRRWTPGSFPIPGALRGSLPDRRRFILIPAGKFPQPRQQSPLASGG